MKLQELLAGIRPADQQAMRLAKARWDSIAKPLGSLGRLEEAVIRMAGIFGTPQVTIDRRKLLIFCADNGVVAQGVTQTGQEVTAVVTENFAQGKTSVCAMAAYAHCDLLPVDIGVAAELREPGVLCHKIAWGTKDLSVEPAMTRSQAEEAILFGAQLVGMQKQQGYQLLATGEMGIGNTTTSSAVVASLLQLPPEQVTGRGAGLSSQGLARKIEVIQPALRLHQPNPDDPIDVLSKVGGLDLAGMAGAFLGGAYYRIPMLVDGLISAAAALIAVRMCPLTADFLFASHISQEPATQYLLDALHMRPLICADMHLGEGSGAVAAIPLLDMAVAVYRQMSTFSDISIDAYQPLI